MGVANYLTFTRLLFAPLFLLFYLEHELFGISSLALPYYLLALLTLSELSDVCDGYLARKYNQVTDLGKILDPMADSMTKISVFLTFTLDPIKIPMYLVFILLYRDSVVSTLRTLCALNGCVLAARLSGKIKSIIQAVAAFLILILTIPHSLGILSTETLHRSGTAIAGLAAAYTVFSGIDYIYANRMHLAKFLSLQLTRN